MAPNHIGYDKYDLQREEKKREAMKNEVSLQQIQIKYKVYNIMLYSCWLLLFITLSRIMLYDYLSSNLTA